MDEETAVNPLQDNDSELGEEEMKPSGALIDKDDSNANVAVGWEGFKVGGDGGGGEGAGGLEGNLFDDYCMPGHEGLAEFKIVDHQEN